MQRRLLAALCALSSAEGLDASWLKTVWPDITDSWVEEFWSWRVERWCSTIAAASIQEKQFIRQISEDHLRFDELYREPPTLRVVAWRKGSGVSKSVHEAVHELMSGFYAPLFYKENGFPNADGTLFHKEHFLDGFAARARRICPYTDAPINKIKLDHFLPKDAFPVLSCHPDNLIPCSTDANNGGSKGMGVPLELDAPDQAANWFHPRLRSAKDAYHLRFSDTAEAQPKVIFEAKDPRHQARVDKLEEMFGLSEFWSRYLDDELQFIAGEISDGMRADQITPTELAVRKCLQRKIVEKKREIGREGLAIVKSSFYEHILATPSLFAQVVRTCMQPNADPVNEGETGGEQHDSPAPIAGGGQ